MTSRRAVIVAVFSSILAASFAQTARADCATPEMEEWEGEWSYYNPVGGGETYAWNLRCVGSTLELDGKETHGDDGETYTEIWSNCVLQNVLRCNSTITVDDPEPNTPDARGTVIATRNGNTMTITNNMTWVRAGKPYNAVYKPTRAVQEGPPTR